MRGTGNAGEKSGSERGRESEAGATPIRYLGCRFADHFGMTGPRA
jgi:hypothetical protein